LSRIAIIKDFNKSCADIVSTATQISDKYTEPLDKVIFEVQTLMQDRDQLSVDELTKYISLIPVMIYNLVDNMQILGVRTDAAKMQRKAEYNKAYLDQATGTVADKTSNAQIVTENEQFIEDIYTRVYKLCDHKIEIATMLHSSLKKILQWKLTEMEVTRNDMLANRR
jgi:hypothetical protein